MYKLLALYDNGIAIQHESLIFLGVAKPGIEMTKKLILKNIVAEDVFDISVTADNNELNIENVPKTLKAHDLAVLVFKYTPDKDAQRGIKAKITIKGVVWR